MKGEPEIKGRKVKASHCSRLPRSKNGRSVNFSTVLLTYVTPATQESVYPGTSRNNRKKFLFVILSNCFQHNHNVEEVRGSGGVREYADAVSRRFLNSFYGFCCSRFGQQEMFPN